jgi:hypothetical protein
MQYDTRFKNFTAVRLRKIGGPPYGSELKRPVDERTCLCKLPAYRLALDALLKAKEEFSQCERRVVKQALHLLSDESVPLEGPCAFHGLDLAKRRVIDAYAAWIEAGGKPRAGLDASWTYVPAVIRFGCDDCVAIHKQLKILFGDWSLDFSSQSCGQHPPPKCGPCSRHVEPEAPPSVSPIWLKLREIGDTVFVRPWVYLAQWWWPSSQLQ